jgi:glycosyltransferase involved in cell wall biosynthesis
MALCRVMRVPYVLEPHGALDAYHLNKGGRMKRMYSRTIDRFGLGGVQAVIYSSDLEQGNGESFLPKARAHRMTLGVPADISSGVRFTSRDRVVLFLGRITLKKRLDLVLESMASLKFPPDVELVVAGPRDPTLPYDPEAMAKTLGVEQRISFLGQVDAPLRRSLLSSASVFVLTSEDESFGMAAAEALAAGCAVVTSSGVGLSSDVAEKGGLAISALDSDALASTVADLFADENRRVEMAKLGHQYALSHFTWTQSASDISDLYESISKNGGTDVFSA